MKLHIPLGLLFSFFLAGIVTGQEKFEPLHSEHQVAPGITWSRVHSPDLFDSPQCINIVKIGKGASVETTIAFAGSKKTTSKLATENNALIGLNGGFFDVQNGGSVTYLKVDGEVIDSIPASGKITEQGALLTSPSGIPVIDLSQKVARYSNDEFYDDVILTGPVLIHNGITVPQDTTQPFIKNRHPRSCACMDEEETLILIAVDGRNRMAAGMSIPELQHYLLLLGCRQAVNLDGGGSTTLWIRGKGVVNHPSDNHQFDTAGERPVANAILIKEKQVNMEQRLTIITLGVKNLEASTRFYTDKFGWVKTPASNEDISFFRLNGILLSLYPHDALAGDAGIDSREFGAGGFTIAYNMRSKQEVDQLIAQLGSKGVRIIKQPQETFWGGYSSYVCDPDGYLWEIAYNPFLPLDPDGNVIDQ